MFKEKNNKIVVLSVVDIINQSMERTARNDCNCCDGFLAQHIYLAVDLIKRQNT
jgi:hypothetical protein